MKILYLAFLLKHERNMAWQRESAKKINSTLKYLFCNAYAKIRKN